MRFYSLNKAMLNQTKYHNLELERHNLTQLNLDYKIDMNMN